MKTLVIGMDGAHSEAFSRGWTPYIASLLEKGTSLDLHEDLISRGWLEIATGKHGVDTGGLYDKPKANGSYEWDLSFSLTDIPELGDRVKPIWQVLGEKGVRVGIMNLPTIFPAPKVNGFLISGGGGGAPVVQAPTAELCYPREEHSLLAEEGYIVDERIVPMLVDKKITDTSEIFSIVKNKNEKRTNSFIRLANKYKIDFGFVVYKSSANLAEWLLLPEWKRMQDGAKDVDLGFIEIIRNYYQHFDAQVKKLHEAFPETELIFTADHGLTPREWSVNPNILLQELEFQKVNSSKTYTKQLIEIVKKAVPFSVRAALRKKKMINRALYSSITFDPKNTKAFCKTAGDWLQGIYINDQDRFGGPVAANEIEMVKSEIIKKFNESTAAKEHGMYAYSRKVSGSSVARLFPDIVVDVADGYLITDKVNSFVKPFTPPKGPLNLLSITKGELLCIKSHKPIAVVYNGSWAVEDACPSLDLTAIYDHVLRSFDVNRDGV
ncbi:alkaline phosphatase family protein [Marinobacter sp.]|uniref:alkaline phosphatase family protein n=1 Tax=Marinobacter sp. TaxID=50741 RepID=UPI001B5DE061|nr:alkaline phosphatase family protein [Marinobacter sp.]MBQ0831298.1 alkaline phosphatase family protein [Marinobacter sp.]